MTVCLEIHSVACQKNYLRRNVTFEVSIPGLLAVRSTIPSSLQDEASEAISDMRGWKIPCLYVDILFATTCMIVILTTLHSGIAGAVVPADAVLVVDT